MMNRCVCGKGLIFKGGSVQGNLKIELYECYHCNKKYEKKFNERIREI